MRRRERYYLNRMAYLTCPQRYKTVFDDESIEWLEKQLDKVTHPDVKDYIGETLDTLRKMQRS